VAKQLKRYSGMLFAHFTNFESMIDGKRAVGRSKHLSVIVDQITIASEYLERNVLLDVYLPADVFPSEPVSLLLLNDGQDLEAINFRQLLHTLYEGGNIEPLFCIGIHCGPDRKNEYGTACQPDYKGWGAKAGLYTKFVFDELLPYIRKKYHITSFKEKSFAGFSLGGLSAFDIVWNNPSQFSKVGIFSGSLWWRRRGYDEGYNDERDRIMHMQVRKGGFYPWLKFYLQTGQLDETADRNNNGIIDSIDDALDMILALKVKGYTDEHIRYRELADGRHTVETWAKALPDFLKWGWKKG
jgi:enterochelin esterase-like enzyme